MQALSAPSTQCTRKLSCRHVPFLPRIIKLPQTAQYPAVKDQGRSGCRRHAYSSDGGGGEAGRIDASKQLVVPVDRAEEKVS